MLVYPEPKFRKRRRKVRPSVTTPTVAIVSITTHPNGAILLFNGQTITAVNDVSQLEIQIGGDWIACDSFGDFSANTVTVACPLEIAAGMQWRVLLPLGVVWDDNPAIVLTVPANGVVQ
jgi:hypothetical protein